MASSFSAPFWLTVAGTCALAAGVAFLVRPQVDSLGGTMATTLDRQDRAAAVPSQQAIPEADDNTQPSPTAAADARARFTIDLLGRLLVNDKTVAVLDSWVAAVGGGEPVAPLEARLHAELPALAAERAWRLVQSHAAYRKAEREMLRELQTRAPLARHELLERQIDLRRRHFDSVSANELFGTEEARGLYATEAARTFADSSQTEAQQAQRLMALRMNLPPEAAAQEFAGVAFSLSLERQVVEMRERGESDAEVVFLRKQFVDVEGARSIIEIEREQIDVERQAWELRHPSFIRARDQTFAAGLDVRQTNERLERLLETYFEPKDRDKARQLGGI